MILKFSIVTEAGKLTEETFFAFLKECSKKHLKVVKFDYKEPTKKIFDHEKPEEVYDLFRQYGNFVLKGKNGFWISVWNYHLDGIILWDGGITVKDTKKTNEVLLECIDVLRSLSQGDQLLFGNITSETEDDRKHKVITNFPTGGRSIGWKGTSRRDFMEYFPGVYWCTAFGKKMYEAIGKERFKNIPNVDYIEFNDETISFKLSIPIDDENLEARLLAETEIANVIGKKYFFDINDLERNPSYPEDLKSWFQSIKKNESS